MSTQNPKLTLLFLAHPLTGHITPTLRVASHFSSLGHKVYFLGPTCHAPRITSAGCIFLPLLDSADINDLTYYTPSSSSTTSQPSDWQSRALVDFSQLWINTIPDSFRSLVSALVRITSEDPSLASLLIISEAMFFGVLPLFLDAPLPPSLSGLEMRSVALSIMVPFIRSAEIGPGFADSLPFLSSRRDQLVRAKNQWSEWESRTSHLLSLLDSKLLEAGAARGVSEMGPFLSGQNYTLGHEKILQLGVPSFFYPRQREGEEEGEGKGGGAGGAGGAGGGWPSNLKFVGVLPPAAEPAAGWPNLPAWWDEVIAFKSSKSNSNSNLDNHQQETTKTGGDDDDDDTKKSNRKIVVVAQGTVEVDPSDLILPTLAALAPYSSSSFSSSSSSSLQPRRADDNNNDNNIDTRNDTSNDTNDKDNDTSNDTNDNNTNTNTNNDDNDDKDDDNSNTNNILVIAILGRKGATLSSSPSSATPPPANARITDYLHYDAILPHADLWVHNGGYGAVQHGIAHGVPMVVAGEGQDKADNAKRVDWSGIGVNVGGARPDVSKLRGAIRKVLTDKNFKVRVEKMRDYYEVVDLGEGEGDGAGPGQKNCLERVEREVLEVGRKRGTGRGGE